MRQEQTTTTEETARLARANPIQEQEDASLLEATAREEAETAHARKRLFRAFWAYGLFPLIYIGGGNLITSALGIDMSRFMNNGIFIGLFLSAYAVMVTNLWHLLRALGKTGRQLERYKDPRHVGMLLELMAAGHPGTSIKKLSVSLARVLPDVRSGDGARLTADQRHQLRRLLAPKGVNYRDIGAFLINKRDFYASLQSAVLSAMVYIGDEKDLAAIERLAQTSRYADIREKATACAEIVRARLEEQRPSRTLLRPASAPDTASTLLRPAASTATDDALLLRASEGDGE